MSLAFIIHVPVGEADLVLLAAILGSIYICNAWKARWMANLLLGDGSKEICSRYTNGFVELESQDGLR